MIAKNEDNRAVFITVSMWLFKMLIIQNILISSARDLDIQLVFIHLLDIFEHLLYVRPYSRNIAINKDGHKFTLK